jgi:hypothetical protein
MEFDADAAEHAADNLRTPPPDVSVVSCVASVAGSIEARHY